MRILYVDVDSLRADHLGCYGYHRNTSPTIDEVATQGVRFENCYCSDAPCLPSRAALFSGRFGIHTGVVDHLGTAADHFVEGPSRGFRSTLGMTNWMRCLRNQGFRTVTVSSYAERHSIFNWLAGFSEVHSVDLRSVERAPDISSIALDWIRRHGREDNWFLHVNFWDLHWPYRTPAEFDNPFEAVPIPAWLTEDIRQQHWHGCGIQSAQDMFDFHIRFDDYPGMPRQASSMADVRTLFDGYDTSLRYVDMHIGYLLDALDETGVLDETAVIISADHGENLGELNIYAGHRLGDLPSTRLPLIVRWPGITHPGGGRVDRALHYHVDLAATVLEMVGGAVPGNWDGQSFAEGLCGGKECHRDYLVISAGAGALTRSVRFDNYLLIRVYHDGYHCLPDRLLFHVENDPHEEHDLAPERPDLVGRAMTLLDEWYGEMMRTATHPQDNMWVSLREGGPQDTRGWLPQYLERLRQTGRSDWAARLAAKHCRELGASDGPPLMRHGYVKI